MSFACKWVAHDQIQPRSMAKCDGHPSPTLCRMTAFMPDHVNGLRCCGSPECQGFVGLHGLDRSFCSSLQRRKAYRRHLPIGNTSLVMQSWESRLPTNGNTDVGSRNGMYVFMGTFVVFVAGLIGGGHQRWILHAVRSSSTTLNPHVRSVREE
jgi:hypothetical protein